MSCGIYQILNTGTGKCYVGSSINIEGTRWPTHKKHLKGTGHVNIKLQRAWNKYGRPDVWEWNILQECEESQLDCLEAFWQARLDSYHNGYDGTLLFLENGKITRRHSEETKAKMRNYVKTSSHLKNWLLSRKGHVVSEITKQKIKFARKQQIITDGLSLKGIAKSTEHKKKIGDKHRGKVVSEETRKKQSEAKKSKPQSKNHIESARLSRIGRKASEETKAKMREAWASRKQCLKEAV